VARAVGAATRERRGLIRDVLLRERVAHPHRDLLSELLLILKPLRERMQIVVGPKLTLLRIDLDRIGVMPTEDIDGLS
jgi:hypothetical protein